MYAKFDPTIPTTPQQAFLYEDDKLIASTWHPCIEDGEGGFRPTDDVYFQIDIACSPTRAVVCNRDFTFRTRRNLAPKDTFSLQFHVMIVSFGRPFRGEELD